MAIDTSRIWAVIPAYNESSRIVAVIQAARRHLPVLVVDDGSSDDTSTLAEANGARLLKQIPNQGKGAALRLGFRFALENNLQAVITLDADGQHNPDEIPGFIAAFTKDEADLIIGQRDFSQMPSVRRIANTSGRFLFSWAMRRAIPDNQSGYRLISARMMEALLNSRETGFEFEVEMIVVCVKSGYRLGWTPIQTIYAGEASHIQPYKHLKEFIRLVWQTRKRMT